LDIDAPANIEVRTLKQRTNNYCMRSSPYRSVRIG